MASIDKNQSSAHEAYIKAITDLRDTHGNFIFLNQILESPGETKFILQEANSRFFLRPLPYLLLGAIGIIAGILAFFGIGPFQQIIFIPFGLFWFLVVCLKMRRADGALYATSMIAYRFGKI